MEKNSLLGPFLVPGSTGINMHLRAVASLEVKLPPCPPQRKAGTRARPPTAVHSPDSTEGLLSHSSLLCSLWFPPPFPHSSMAPNRPPGAHTQIPTHQSILLYSHLEQGTQPGNFSSWRPKWSEASFLLSHSWAVEPWAKLFLALVLVICKISKLFSFLYPPSWFLPFLHIIYSIT